MTPHDCAENTPSNMDACLICGTPADVPVPADALACPCGCCTAAAAAAGTNCFAAHKLPPTGPAMDHSGIPAGELRIALANAALDPDGQVFPWLPGYPLIGSTVYLCHDAQLYTVVARERGPGKETGIKLCKLVGQGHDGRAVMTRDELRPVTWTQSDEDWLDVDSQLGRDSDAPTATVLGRG